MSEAAREHACEYMPVDGVAILPATEDFEVEEWPWLILIERCATWDDLEQNQYLEEVGETIWRTMIGITHCPFCGKVLQSDVEPPTDSPKAEFYHLDASGWIGRYR